jgi:arylsulfatase A-like enzyme
MDSTSFRWARNRRTSLPSHQRHRLAAFILIACAACSSISSPSHAAPADSRRKPNIVLILADDLGYGDVRCNNPAGKIATVKIDRLAAAGMRFTDAHSSSSVCTPTRYSLLTGRYNWRTRLQSSVQGGLSPPLIDARRLTVAGMLRGQGYHTACIGKWHLGMTWPRKPGTAAFDDRIEMGPEGWNVDFARPITDGPTTRGFDYYFGISASLDMVPYTFLENDRVTVVPSVDKTFALMPGKPATTRRGPGAARFEAVDVLPMFTRKAVDYIDQRAAEARAGKPFFLYLPLNSPHTPIAPTPAWQGRSGLNPYADFVLQTDDCVGQVLAALEKNRLADDTLVLFTSDNGCSPQADFPALLAQGHNPSSVFRGHKADIWDGGHRVPFIVRWPGKVAAGGTCDQLVCLVDVMATCAAVVDAALPPNAGEDSVSFLPALLGKADKPLREALVHHSINGRFAIRQGRWKLELCPGSGGWSVPRDPQAVRQKLPAVQLYDMGDDLGEQRNRQADQPEVVARLTQLLQRYVDQGRSTPGPTQRNDVEVDLWKRAPAATPKPARAKGS